MRRDVNEEDLLLFKEAVARSIREFRDHPEKGYEFLIRAGTHEWDGNGKLVLVPQLRTTTDK